MLLLRRSSRDAQPISRRVDYPLVSSLKLLADIHWRERYFAPRRTCSQILQPGSISNAVGSEDPYTEESYGGFLGAPPVAIDSGVYNSTEGYFCVTSLLTQLSAYYGAEPSVPFLTGLVTGANETALELTKEVNPNIICNDCIFAAAAIVDRAYPDAGNVPFDAIFSLLNMSSPLPEGTTINEYANDTCAYQGRSVSTGEPTVFKL